MKYLILGNGYIGNRLKELIPDSVISSVRVNSLDDALFEIDDNAPKVVINAIGKCGKPNVDWCQNHMIDTMMSNVQVPIFIAKACRRMKVKMVHLGSGCLYEGSINGSGYREEDHANFGGSVYSVSKNLAEHWLKEFPGVLQLRIRMPIDCVVHPRNLISKLIGYSKIIDVPNSVSYVPDVARAVQWLTDSSQSGIFNVVNGGSVRHPQILDAYQKFSGTKLDYSIISTKELEKMTAAGRSNCILSNKKLLETGFVMPGIDVVMPEAVAAYVDHKRMLETGAR